MLNLPYPQHYNFNTLVCNISLITVIKSNTLIT